MSRPSRSIDQKALWLVPLALLVVTTLAFPRSGAAGLALVLLVGAAGVALVWFSERVTVDLPRWAPDALVALVVVGASAALFRGNWSQSGLRTYDWGPHHANLKNLVDGLRHGAVPRWVQGVSTGDSPYELYPLLPYWLLARAAILFGTSDLTLVLVRAAVVTHTLAALGGGLLARRLLAWPWGALVGLVLLFDVGSVWGGGMDGLFKLGVLHAAMANAVFPFVLVSVVDALRRPSLATSARIWLTVALAIGCHPLALLSAAATLVALLLVALVAKDVPARRALACAFHVGLGVLLVAASFMPLNARLLAYGVHFGLAGQLSFEHFGMLLSAPVPQATVGPLVFAGYLGVAAGLASRRAVPLLLAGMAGLLLLGLLDQPYVLLHLVPSLEGSRFQTTRLASAAKASVYVLGCYVLWLVASRVRPALLGRGRYVLGAVALLAVAAVLRGAVPYVDRLAVTLRDLAHTDIPDEDGMRKLAEWARAENARQRPGRFGRLLHEDDRRFYSVYHVNALSGLPTLWVGPVSCLFLRERIEDASPASLRRFDVRWVMHRDGPPSLGNPATERRFGRYFVRELADWDGRFARVERGAGEAIVTALENERVDVDVQGTSGPALVALGMGYYPRWQAVHERLGVLPVYAWPSVEGGKLSVPAAWLPPGHTTFRPTGALPSDGKGRFLSLFSALLALAISVAWGYSPWRCAALRRLAVLSRAMTRMARPRARLALGASLAVAVVVLVLGVASSGADAASLQVGSALRGAASVEERSPGGEWRPCSYSAWHGGYRCHGALLVQDSVVDLLLDAPPSPPFSVPAIVVSASDRDAEVRVHLDAQLAGEYWAISAGGATELAVSDGVVATLDDTQKQLTFVASREARALTLRTSVAAGQRVKIAVVRRDRLDPDRSYPRAPATSPRR